MLFTYEEDYDDTSRKYYNIKIKKQNYAYIKFAIE